MLRSACNVAVMETETPLSPPVRIRTSWTRWEGGKLRVTHPFWWVVADETGYERFFDTKKEALAWVSDNGYTIRETER